MRKQINFQPITQSKPNSMNIKLQQNEDEMNPSELNHSFTPSVTLQNLKSRNQKKKQTSTIFPYDILTVRAKTFNYRQIQENDSVRVLQQEKLQNQSELQRKNTYFEDPDKITRLMRSKINNLKYPRFIIPMNHKVKMAWDLFIILVIFWLTLFIPWQIAFPQDSIKELDILIIILFILDILLTFRTTYQNEEGDEIINGKMIFFKYIKSLSFSIDFISMIPINEIYRGNDQTIGRVLSVLKIVRLARLNRLIKLLKNDQLKLLSQMLTYVFYWIICFHWISLIWISILQQSFDESNFNPRIMWIPANLQSIYSKAPIHIQSQIIRDFYFGYNHLQQYLFCYYCMVITIVGSDISPITVGQSYYLVFVGIFGWISLAYLFGEVLMTLSLTAKENVIYERKQDQMMFTLYRQKLPQQVITKALSYFDYCWKKKIQFFTQGKDIQDFSFCLQRDCYIYLYKPFFKQITFFSCFSEQLITLMAKMVFQ